MLNRLQVSVGRASVFRVSERERKWNILLFLEYRSSRRSAGEDQFLGYSFARYESTQFTVELITKTSV